jgi:2-oxo-4-hydroxy-4-carboxy-5-ureidoimidazoline decarboxylase
MAGMVGFAAKDAKLPQTRVTDACYRRVLQARVIGAWENREVVDGAAMTARTTVSLDSLNAADTSAFVAALGDIYEHASWVAERAAAARPFATVTDLHGAMERAVAAASPHEQLSFLRGHPELAGTAALGGTMAPASKQEQGGLGLDRLQDEELARFARLNASYAVRFGFPFIVCVRRHTRDSILAQFEERLANNPQSERAAALREIGHITRLRICERVDGPGKANTQGRLSTHVLDTVAGKPAAGVSVVLMEMGARSQSVLKQAVTNSDGRTDEPLISGAPLRIGHYLLEFHVGPYFAARATATANPAYLDIVPVRFAIAEPEGHYHVPLLVSPWSYATYRGS